MNSSKKPGAAHSSETARTLRLLRMACGLSCEEAAQAFEFREQDIKLFEAGTVCAPANYLLALQATKEKTEAADLSVKDTDYGLDLEIAELTAAFHSIDNQSLRKSLIAVVKAAAQK